jgi:coproporphyrinogen III oxidase-like Fe-S oxidoreductase
MSQKRGSALFPRKSGRGGGEPPEQEEIEVNSGREWVQANRERQVFLAATGYSPYYLYRQKYAVGNQENIGYTLPGAVCRYNIGVIAEALPLLGLGAGAGSKIFDGDRHRNCYEPADITAFLQKYLPDGNDCEGRNSGVG